MFSGKMKKMLSALLLSTFILGIPAVSFAHVEQESLMKDDEIFVLKVENPGEGEWGYQKNITSNQSSLRDETALKAVLDENSGLYKITSESNVYLIPVSEDSFQPVERSSVNDQTDLLTISAQYSLTQTQSDDINSIMNENPNVQIVVYAPNINEMTGTINEKKCRLVQVTARDNLTEYYLGKGSHTIFSILNTLGSKMTVGLAITHGLLNFFGVDFDFHSDSSSIAQKNEVANFQYLDFFELNSTYITRGTSSFGSIAIQTTTTNWVKKSNGDFVNQPTIKSMSGQFGTSHSLSSLAKKCDDYFEDYSDIGQISYTNYITCFKIDRWTSIPSIFPKR